MDICKNVQNSIEDFDKEKLNLKSEERFYSHILSCKDCRDEMELFYIISYGLDDEGETIAKDKKYSEFYESFDFKGLVDKKLMNSKEKCDFYKQWFRFNRFRYLYVMSVMGLTFAAGVIILFF